MRRMSLRVWVAGVVASLAVPVTAVATAVPIATPAGAVVACTSTQAPVSEGATAAFTLGCTTDFADQAPNPVIFDYDNARWHAASVRAAQSCSWSPASTTITCGLMSTGGGAPWYFPATTGATSLVNHAVTGGGQKDGIAGGTYVVSVAGSPSLSITVSQLPTTTKAGNGKLWIENTQGRNVKALATTSGSATVTAAAGAGSVVNANFNTATDVTGGGASISSSCIQKGTVITAVASATSATMSKVADCASSGQDGSVDGEMEGSAHRTVTDLAVPSSGSTVTSASADFTANDVGLGIKCSCLQTNSYISAFNSSTSVDVAPVPGTKFTKDPIATAETGTPNGVATIGMPSLSAPRDADMAAALLTQIQLDPGFVSGSRACAAGEASGFTLAGKWYNPGKFQKMNFLGVIPVPDVTGAVAQIVYATSVTTFAGYVVKDPTTDEYQIVLPFVPTSIANCSGASVAAGFSFIGSSNSQGLNPSAVGRPGTSAVRGIEALNAAGTSSVESPSYENDDFTSETQTLSISSAGVSGTYTLDVDCTGDGTPDGTSTAIKNTDIAKNVAKAIRSIEACELKVFVTGTGGTKPDTGKCQSPNICTINFQMDPGDGPGNGLTYLFGRGDSKGENMGLATTGTFTGTLTGGNTTVTAGTTGGVVTHGATGTSCTVARPATFGFPCGLG